jgi:hypothetical protein
MGGINSGGLGGGGTVEWRCVDGRCRVAFDTVRAQAGLQGIDVAWIGKGESASCAVVGNCET